MKITWQPGIAVALLVVLLTSSMPSVAGKTYYRWKDDRGYPVLSDTPPKGIDYEVVSSGTSMVRKVSASEGAVPASVEPTPGNEFQQVESKVEEVKKNPETCKRARSILQTLDGDAQIQSRNAQGELYTLSEEEIEAERHKAEDAAAVHCN